MAPSSPQDLHNLTHNLGHPFRLRTPKHTRVHLDPNPRFSVLRNALSTEVQHLSTALRRASWLPSCITFCKRGGAEVSREFPIYDVLITANIAHSSSMCEWRNHRFDSNLDSPSHHRCHLYNSSSRWTPAAKAQPGLVSFGVSCLDSGNAVQRCLCKEACQKSAIRSTRKPLNVSRRCPDGQP